MKRRYLLYKDTFITLFNDDEKCLVVFLTDNGHAKAINYDDNFYYVEYLIDTYLEMIIKSFKGWRNKTLDKGDWQEITQQLKKFVRYLKKHEEIENCCICKEARGLLGYENN